ncbi:uncharacterized protein [Epargyreus clarus]|uniref:uncharacterized protein n=1 Tax=Epargyreus clarus TaxID=520877 RepID=UPI003C2B45D0
MLPSMPILFTRESQDAFGNKIEPSTSFFNPNSVSKPAIKTETTICKAEQGPSTLQTKEKDKTQAIKKEEPPKPNNNALEAALVRSYYAKVKSRFGTNPSAPTNKFVQFRELLKTFDPTKETPVDLYRKVENLLGEEHKDIVEEFLLFLKPGQAATVGRLMDHLVQTQILSFIELLQKSFSRKPTVLRKVLRALTTGINSGSSQEMKTRVLPHLRSNPRLTQMFKSLFPDERPPDSVYETGTDIINESFLTSDNGCDVWEFEETNDNKRKIEVKESLDTVYLHGRVFLQHGRMLKTACVTYPYSKEPYRAHVRRLAPNHCRLSPPESDEERSSPKRTTRNTCKIPPKRTKKQLKSPTKQVKDVNDNTKHKESLPQTINKAVKGKAHTKTKNCRDKKDETKTEQKKKQEKNIISLKKDEGKVKQADKKVEPPKVESRSWTREEDKTMLQVLKGEARSEQIFRRISELLPHRSATEIKERFCYVMNLLQQMAVSEVT